MKVKLIFPFISTTRYDSHSMDMPYGLGVLTSRLRQNNIDVNAVDAKVKLNNRYSTRSAKRISEELLKFHKRQVNAGTYVGIADRKNNILADNLLKYVNVADYDVIGMSVLSSSQMLPALLLSEKIKKEFNKTIVWGGPHVTSFAHLFFKQYDFIDYAIVGDGEEPLVKLIRYLEKKESLHTVPSLWTRSNGEVICTQRMFFNIEDQACPDFDDLPLELYKHYIKPGVQNIHIPYSTSRGCGNQCSYCMYPSIDGPWQSKSVDKVMREIDFLKSKYQSKFFIFRDSSITMSKSFVDQLCDTLIRKNTDIVWSANIDGIDIDEPLIAKMKYAGCETLSWGIQSGSKNILTLMHRNSNIEYQEKMLQSAKKSGIRNLVFLIMTYPSSTVADYKSTIAFIKNNAHAIEWVKTYNLVIYHGSSLFCHANKLPIPIKLTSDSFFTYSYFFQEVDDAAPKRRKLLKQLRRQIIYTCYRYVFAKRVRFPFTILGAIFAKYFGKSFQDLYTVMVYKLRIKEELLRTIVFRQRS